MQNADEKRIRNIISGAIAFAGDGAEVGTIGWCFGGGWSMQAAIMLGDQALGSVVYYGMPEQNAEKLKSLQAPVLGIFAEKDQWINREEVSKYESAMDRAGKEYESHWFNADHAFANPSNSIYDADATAKAKEKAAGFLSARLVR
jgi:carboxymethylenebutenolidase